MFADRSDKANTQLALGMRHDDDAASLRMSEHVVRTPDPLQDPAGLLQLADKVSTSHCVYCTHRYLFGQDLFRRPRLSVFQIEAITCIVSQVAASAGFCAPSISTLTS
jgi:hypothetical protein